MRGIRKVTLAIVLFSLPTIFASGCAGSATAGTSFAPVSPVATSVQTPMMPMRGIVSDLKTAAWPQFGYDRGHTGYNPLEKIIGVANVSKLQVAWNDQSLVQPGGIVYDKNVLYVDDMGQSNAGLYAFNAKTGAQKWYANVNFEWAMGQLYPRGFCRSR